MRSRKAVLCCPLKRAMIARWMKTCRRCARASKMVASCGAFASSCSGVFCKLIRTCRHCSSASSRRGQLPVTSDVVKLSQSLEEARGSFSPVVSADLVDAPALRDIADRLLESPLYLSREHPLLRLWHLRFLVSQCVRAIAQSQVEASGILHLVFGTQVLTPLLVHHAAPRVVTQDTIVLAAVQRNCKEQ